MPPEFDFVCEIMAFLNEALSIVLTDLASYLSSKYFFPRNPIQFLCHQLPVIEHNLV